MAISSSANIIVDPDGDLVLLLNPTIPNSSQSDSCFPPEYSDHILGNFREAITLKTTGKLELPLPDDEPAAMKILINIIHGRMKLIPSKIDLELFTQLAILVDKYHCVEVVCPYHEIWTNTMQACASTCGNMARWLCIAWQFEMDAKFHEASTWIETYGTCDLVKTMAIMKYSLPIPKPVTDKIERHRQEGIRKAVKHLEDFITMYQNSNNTCAATRIPDIEYKNTNQKYAYSYSNIGRSDTTKISFLSYGEVFSYRRDCDSMLLGSLTKSAIEHGLFPLPASPYTSWSMASLRHRIELLQASSLCSKLLKTSVVQHDILDRLKKSVRAIMISGLTLKRGKELAGKT